MLGIWICTPEGRNCSGCEECVWHYQCTFNSFIVNFHEWLLFSAVNFVCRTVCAGVTLRWHSTLLLSLLPPYSSSQPQATISIAKKKKSGEKIWSYPAYKNMLKTPNYTIFIEVSLNYRLTYQNPIIVLKAIMCKLNKLKFRIQFTLYHTTYRDALPD